MSATGPRQEEEEAGEEKGGKSEKRAGEGGVGGAG